MSRPEFFALEAGEYLERIAQLARKPAPDREHLRRLARALRSAALMGGPPGYAVAAGAVEDVARRYQDGVVRWTPWLAGRLGAGVGQCQMLLRRLREWSVAEIDLCRRIAEALQLEDPGEAVVPIESLAPDDEIIPIEALAPDDDLIVDIASLAPAPIRFDADPVVSIESLLFAEELEIVAIETLLMPVEAGVARPEYNAFEQSFATLFRLMHGTPPLTADTPIPIQQLLYRGRRALERADWLRQELAAEWQSRGASPFPQYLIDELFDLVPLALEHE